MLPQFIVCLLLLVCRTSNLRADPIASWDFEKILNNKSANPKPDGWITSTPKTASLASDEFHSADHALRIAMTAVQTSPNQPTWQTDFIPVQGKIQVSGWMKTNQVLVGKVGWYKARLYFSLYDKNHKPVMKLSSGHADVAMVSGTTPWTHYQWQGKLPDEVAYIRIVCTLSHTTGIAWFDDIAVQNTPESDIEKQQKLEGERLLLGQGSTSAVPEPTQKVHVTVDPVPMPNRNAIKFPSYFATIKGNRFYRDGHRVFLLGAESSGVVYPYLYKLLGIDFISLTDTYGSASVGDFQNKGDNWHVSWHPYEYLPVELNSLLSNHLMPYISFQEVAAKYIPLFKADPRLFAERGHFLSYSPLNPLGEELRWDTRKALINSIKDQPVWAWELFNEVYYRCNDEADLDIFRQWAKAHYGTIDQANAAWKTYFTDFDQVTPPNPGFNMAMRINMPSGASDQLFTDFMKSQEEVFGDYLQKSHGKMKELDPSGYVTVQSTSNLKLDYVDSGVRPELKAKGEDFYGAENPQALYFQGKQNDPDEITDMLTTPMVYDITRAAAGDRPIVDEESTLSGRGGPKQEMHPLIDIEGTWRFHSEQDANESKQWSQPNFDDNNWKTIQVPGLWGKQGFANTQVGWYRRTFQLPVKPALLPDEKVLLQGRGLTDKSTIYLNGQKIYKTSTWNEKFSLDITSAVRWDAKNNLTIRIENHYLNGGFYWGGIRDYLQLMIGVPQSSQPLGPGQMRSWLWTKAVHGCAGSVLSYVYANEASPQYYSPFSPYKIQPAALKTIASTHQKINNLASMVLNVSDEKGERVGLIYPITTFRARIPKDYTDYLQAPLTHHLAGYYGSLLLNHIPFDMVMENQLQDVSRYRAIVLAVAPRVSEKMVNQLETYVRNGGTLLVSADSLVINDDTNSSLGNISWLPDRAQTGANQTGKTLGKGHIYMLPASAALPDLQKTIASLLARTKIQPHLLVTQKGDASATCVEAHTFGGGHRMVWYLMNWGAQCDAIVGAPQILPQGKSFFVRDAISGTTINSPTGKATWSPQQLDKGISMTIPCQDPRVLLIEDSAVRPMSLTNISPELQKQINQAWHPTIASDQKVLFDGSLYERMTPVMIPTAVNTMEKAGYGVYTSLTQITADKPFATWDGQQISQRPLKDFQVLIYSCPQGNVNISSEQINAVKQFVASGGGLLLLANPPHGPHGWLSTKGINELAKSFGITVKSQMLQDKNHCQNNQPLLPIFTNITADPVTANVHTFNPAGCAPLQIESDSAKVLIRSSASASVPNAPVLAVTQFGRGRVAVIGSGYWLEPDNLTQGDNQQLLSDLLHWLSPTTD
jgi:hypothetical protein